MATILLAKLIFLQYSSPGQQNHPAFGQQPPGHTVPSQSCLVFLDNLLGAAMATILLAKLIFLQYSSLAAQYSSPGQQNHPALGQQPPGHTVPSQSCFTFFNCLLGAAIAISLSA